MDFTQQGHLAEAEEEVRRRNKWQGEAAMDWPGTFIPLTSALIRDWKRHRSQKWRSEFESWKKRVRGKHFIG